MNKLFLQFRKFLKTEVPANYKREFDIYILGINIKRGKITAVTVIILELITDLVTFILKPDGAFEKPQIYYLIMYVLWVIIMSFFLLVFIQFEKNIEQNRRAIWIAGVAFASVILGWCAGLTLFEQLTSSQIIDYTVAIVCVAVVPLYSPRTLFFIYLTVETAFILFMPFFQQSSELIFNNNINSAYYVALSWVISNIMYKNKISDFCHSKIIQEKNAELQKMNQKLIEANSALEKLSVTDGLTKLYNRSYFDHILKVEWERCKRYQFPISLVMVDIDYFKEYNDNYGHLAGDTCIRQVAGVLSECSERSSDVAARYGGDEFAVILPHMVKEEVSVLAYRLVEKVYNLTIPHEYSHCSSVITISIGTNTIIPSDESSILEFIGFSDKALYEAKKIRNSVVVT